MRNVSSIFTARNGARAPRRISWMGSAQCLRPTVQPTFASWQILQGIFDQKALQYDWRAVDSPCNGAYNLGETQLLQSSTSAFRTI